MIVRFIKDDFEDLVLKNKLYKVVEIVYDYYVIIDEKNNKDYYPVSCFEVVDDKDYDLIPKIEFDYSKIKDFDDIPYHGSPSRYEIQNDRLPKGFRGKEKKYIQYLKDNNIDSSSLTIEDVEELLKKL